MKIIISNELKSRLINASYNGSKIATDVLGQLSLRTDSSNIIRGNANYFSTIRKVHNLTSYTKMRIVITACTKELTNEKFPDKNNPQAPWFKENRTILEPSTFVNYFKGLPEYSSEELEYFASAICLDSKVKVKVYDKMADFFNAYNGGNYSPFAQTSESSLHSSCMRHDFTASCAADFYHNFAGAKILVATDSANNILGRAVLWERAYGNLDGRDFIVSVLDRVYYTHIFVMKMIYNYAAKIGVNLHKEYNDYSHTRDFEVINPVDGMIWQPGEFVSLTLKIKPLFSKWHKQGGPYMDTFFKLILDPFNGLALTNEDNEYSVAHFRSIEGQAVRDKNVCPKCNCLHGGSQLFCSKCFDEMTEVTPMGRMLVGKTTKYNNESYPAVLFNNGRPNPEFSLYLQLNRLF